MTQEDELLFTTNHQWIRIDNDNICTVGITDYAQSSLSNIINVDMPATDELITDTTEEIAIVESLTNSMPLFIPVPGKIIEINSSLLTTPELINEDPFDKGWIFKMEVEDIKDLDNLLKNYEYDEHIPDDE